MSRHRYGRDKSARTWRRIVANREGRLREAKVVRVRGEGFYLDDDWFRFWFRDGDDPRTAEPYRTEVHELCSGKRCTYRDEPCPWHPRWCKCSSGACQE